MRRPPMLLRCSEALARLLVAAFTRRALRPGNVASGDRCVRGTLAPRHHAGTNNLHSKALCATGRKAALAPRHYWIAATRCRHADLTLRRPATIRGSDGAGATDGSATRAAGAARLSTVSMRGTALMLGSAFPAATPPIARNGAFHRISMEMMSTGTVPHSRLVPENATEVSNQATVVNVTALGIARRSHQVALSERTPRRQRPLRSRRPCRVTARVMDGRKNPSGRRQPPRCRRRRVTHRAAAAAWRRRRPKKSWLPQPHIGLCGELSVTPAQLAAYAEATPHRGLVTRRPPCPCR